MIMYKDYYTFYTYKSFAFGNASVLCMYKKSYILYTT